jgi:CRISPR/Cas system CSM-associated protein Csm2 small subunit
MENNLVGDPLAASGTFRDITYGDNQLGPSTASSVASNAENVGGVNPINFAAQLTSNPSSFFNNEMLLGQSTPTIDANTVGTSVDGSSSTFFTDPGRLQTQTSLGDTATAGQIDARTPASYDAATTLDRVTQSQNTMQAAQGEVRPDAVIDAPQLDMRGMATGTNVDGSTNFTGQALNQYASQNIASVIDTSTVSGRLLAETLGEGNYTDAKATVLGQLDIISKEFVDPATGEPKIPTWAAGVARNVSRIAAFSGMTGTAATAAMAQALMEASLPIAQQEAQFFQTVTMQNLNNRQQQIINTANVLSKMELTNMDMKLTTAVENAKNFMQMDLTNLSNEQQSRLVNTQARVQSILEDAKAVNTSRLFAAESENEMNKFYDSLRTQISTFNATQKNGMEQFNSGALNDTSRFNAELENSREKFYKEMQYNIDIANTKWRQSVTLANNEMAFQAAATDVKNLVGLSVEALNQLWDRSDALLDYAWKESQNQAELQFRIAAQKEQAQLDRDKINAASKGGGFGSIVGSIAGTALGSLAGGIGGTVGEKAGAAIGAKLFE